MTDTLNAYIRRIPTWPLYMIGGIYPAWLLWQGLTGALGVDPVKVMEHTLGERALQLLIVGLFVSPLRRHVGINLLRFRRLIGVMAFFYVALHLLVWLVLDVQILSQVWADILKRPYITVGMGAFVLMLPLAITSNNWSMRKMGPAWRRLHKLTYVTGLLGGLHFVMLAKGFQIEPLLYMAAILVALMFRVRFGFFHRFV